MKPAGECQGCPEPTGEVKLYRARFDGGGWTFVEYCEECARLAALNYNGCTDAIEPAFQEAGG